MKISKRDFIHAGCAVAAAATLSTPILDRALAWTHGSTAIVRGTIGMNGFASNPNTDYMYKNFFKGVASFTSTNNVHQECCDDNGYPTVGTLTADMVGAFVIPAAYAGTWRVDWLGKNNARFAPGGGITLVSDPSGVVTSLAGGMTFVGGGGAGTRTYIEFSFTSVGVTNCPFRFIASGDFTSLSDMRVFRISSPYTGDMAALDGGNPAEQWNSDFLAAVTVLNTPILRLMDLSPANFSNITRASLVAQASCMSYAGFQFYQRIWSGNTSTSDSGATYTVAANPSTPVGAYVDGETAQIKITGAANSGTAPQLEVGSGRGFKTIKNPVTGSYGAFTAGQLSLNSVWTVYFDAIADCWVGQSGGLTNTVPLSLRVGLSNKLLMDHWHNISFVFDDASVTTEVTYIRVNLNASLNNWEEPANEVWNGGFFQTKTAEARGTALGWSTSSNQNYHSYYGLKFCQWMDLANAAWSPRSAAQLKKVLAYQHAGSVSNINTYRFLGTNLGAYGFNSAPNRPIDKCTHISGAPYLSGSCIRTGDSDQPSVTFSAGEIAAFQDALDDFDSGDPVRIQEAFDWIDNDFRAGLKSGSLGGGTIGHLLGVVLPNWSAIAATHSKAMVFYEFGYEGKAPTTTQFTNVFGLATSYSAICQSLINAYKLDDRFKNSIIYAFDQSYANAAELDFIVYYLYSGASKWSIVTGVLGSAVWKSWNAVYEYNT